MVQALEDIKKAGCNALCVYLGNFGPEISETLLAKHFDGPAMFIAAAEESQNDLVGGRGDAYCGMLNASYNLKLRNVKAYIPENPVGTAAPSPRATACSIFWTKRPSSTRSPASRKLSSPARRPSTSRFPTAGRTFSPTFPSASRRGASSALWAAVAAENRRF